MKNISVRFTDEEFEKMKILADRYQVPQSTVIRWALNAIDDYAAQNNGKITLPLDFSKALEHQSQLNEPETEYNK